MNIVPQFSPQDIRVLCDPVHLGKQNRAHDLLITNRIHHISYKEYKQC